VRVRLTDRSPRPRITEDVTVKRNIERRDRILAPVAIRDADGNVIGANLGALVRRLILFGEVVIDSYGMRELPALIEALGPEQFVQLLDSGAVLIRADGWVLGEVGNDAAALGRHTPLPPLSFALAPLVPAQEYRKDTISRHLGAIRDMPLDMKTSQRVRRAIVDSLTPFPEHPGQLTMNQLPTDLTMRLDLVDAATDWALREFGNRDTQGVEYSIRLHQETADVFRAETDIGERFALTEDEVDRVLELRFSPSAPSTSVSSLWRHTTQFQAFVKPSYNSLTRS
jgi:hypothetical protein